MTAPRSSLDALQADAAWLQSLARRLASATDADDLAQETWLAAHSTALASSGSRRPWLARVLRNRARMRARQAGQRGAHSWRLRDAAPDVEPERALHEKRVLERLLDGLAQLRPADQQIIEWKILEEASTTDVADRLGITPASVRSRLSRALERLRQRLDRQYGGRDSWAAAVLVAPLPGRSVPSIVQGGTTMALWTKIGVGALAAAGLFWLLPEPEASSTGPDSVVVSVPETPIAASRDHHPTKARARWQLRREEVQRAQARRIQTDPVVDSADPEVMSAMPQTISAEQWETVNDLVFRETQATIADCLEDIPDGATGTLEFDIHVIGERGAGAVIDHIQTKSDTTTDADLRACLLEGAPAFDISDIDLPLDKTFNFTADLSERSLTFTTDIPVDDIDAYLARLAETGVDPEFLQTIEEGLRESEHPRVKTGRMFQFLPNGPSEASAAEDGAPEKEQRGRD